MIKPTDWNERIVWAHKRPEMYLGDGQMRPPVAQAYLGLAASVLSAGWVNPPQALEFNTCGEHHAVIAYGCGVPDSYDGTGHLAEWLYTAKHPAPQWALAQAIGSIVILAEHCLLDISTPEVHLRQSYCEGQPIAACQCKPLPAKAPYISLHFCLSTTLFTECSINLNQMRQAWQRYRRDHSDPRRGTENTMRPYLPHLPGARAKSHGISQDTFVFRVEWERPSGAPV